MGRAHAQPRRDEPHLFEAVVDLQPSPFPPLAGFVPGVGDPCPHWAAVNASLSPCKGI